MGTFICYNSNIRNVEIVETAGKRMKNQPTLDYRVPNFYFHCEYEYNEMARRAGFCWDRGRKCWVTPFCSVVEKVAHVFCFDGKTLLNNVKRWVDREVEDSHAVSLRPEYLDPHRSTFHIPVPEGLEYLPFQKAGIQSMFRRDNVLLADSMGLGKTIQVIGLCNLIDADEAMFLQDVLIICPAIAKLHWLKKWKEWFLGDLSVEVVSKKRQTKFSANVVIINYDIIASHKESIQNKKWDLFVFDESHYIKNQKSGRAKTIVGSKGRNSLPQIQATRKIALTGTPIKNRVIELFTTIDYLLPHAYQSRFQFAKKHCDATRGRFGWDFSGASNLDELQRNLRGTIMIRRTKEEVLPDLPKKVRQIIELDVDSNTRKALKAEKSLWSKLCREQPIKDNNNLSDEDFKHIIHLLKTDKKLYNHVSIVRKETAIVKVPLVIQHLHDAIDSSGKVVCFCHHHDVVHKLQDGFRADAVTVYGNTSMKQREVNVDRFQNETKVKLFIGNIQAAGTVISLTASSHVVFAELSWVPGDMNQAEDRCHRIGTVDSVLVQHLVLAGSIDARMAKVVIKKQDVIEKVLDVRKDDEPEISFEELLGGK